jgi:cytochrome oxidase Cu insertion factor (SCO1/SenC/PrrC family)
MRSHRRTLFAVAAAFSVYGAAASTAAAQQPAGSQPAAAGPAVGDVAPDFTLRGATRYGLLQTPIRLSDYRGSTVVLAFFYQARTKG